MRQLPAEELEPEPDEKAEPDGERDSGPDPAEHVAASLLAEERGDDADDQGRLDALAQADHERGDHAEAGEPERM